MKHQAIRSKVPFHLLRKLPTIRCQHIHKVRLFNKTSSTSPPLANNSNRFQLLQSHLQEPICLGLTTTSVRDSSTDQTSQTESQTGTFPLLQDRITSTRMATAQPRRSPLPTVLHHQVHLHLLHQHSRRLQATCRHLQPTNRFSRRK